MVNKTDQKRIFLKITLFSKYLMSEQKTITKHDFTIHVLLTMFIQRRMSEIETPSGGAAVSF